jgi:hypothetical protein
MEGKSYIRAMNLREELEKTHSKAQNDRIVRYVGDDHKRMKELMQLFAANEPVITQRAAWAMSYIASAHPHLIAPYHNMLLERMMIPGVHDAVKRNTLRIWQEILPPEDLLGAVYDECFRLLRSVEEPPAIKAFSMTVLYNIVVRYPELREELLSTIEDMIPYGTPAIVSRGKKVAKLLKKV